MPASFFCYNLFGGNIMHIRRALEKDLERIEEIYDAILKDTEDGLIHTNWKRGVYPTRQTAKEGIEKKELFVLIDREKILGAAKINQEQVPEYKNASWEYEVADNLIMAIHTLTIDPKFKNRGCGKYLMNFYEDYALIHSAPYLRMDTVETNIDALSFYKKLGFKNVGTVSCTFNGIPNTNLVCLEKSLVKTKKKAE